MNFKIENSGNFVVLTNLDTGEIEKKFVCPVTVDYYDSACCGVPNPYFIINNYQIDAAHLAQINGVSSLSADYKATLMNTLMCDCPFAGGGTTPDLLDSLIETSGAGVFCLASDTSRKGTVEKIRLEDGTFDKWVWSEIGGAGSTFETIDLSNYVICPKDQITFETCKSYTFDIFKAGTLCFADIVTLFATKGIATTVNDIVGFEFVLKSLDGESTTNSLATTSEASSTGAQGDRNLDGGGKFQVIPQRLPDNNFHRLSDQCFTVAVGSVAVLSIQYI